MAAMTASLIPGPSWLHGMPATCRRPWAGTLATGKKLFIGALTLSVDGVAQPVVSGAAMTALCSAFGAGDSQVIVSARRGPVRFSMVDPLGNSKPLGIVIVPGNPIDVVVNLATNGGGTVTSTSSDVVQAIRAHSQANHYLRAKHGGNGTGVVVPLAATLAKVIQLEGVCYREIDNLAGVAPLQLMPDDVFHLGKFGVLPLGGAAPKVDQWGFLADDQTVAVGSDPLALAVKVLHVDVQGLYFVDLEGAE